MDCKDFIKNNLSITGFDLLLLEETKRWAADEGKQFVLTKD